MSATTVRGPRAPGEVAQPVEQVRDPARPGSAAGIAATSSSVMTRTPATSTAPIATPAAQTRKTAPAPGPDTISPAASGAIAMLTFWTVPDATFAAVSSFGVLASDGRIEPWAGRVSVTDIDVSVASA